MFRFSTHLHQEKKNQVTDAANYGLERGVNMLLVSVLIVAALIFDVYIGAVILQIDKWRRRSSSEAPARDRWLMNFNTVN